MGSSVCVREREIVRNEERSWAGRGIGGRVTAARDAMDIFVIGVIWSFEGGVLGLGGRRVTFTSMGGSFRPWGVL